MAKWWNNSDKETKIFAENPVIVPLFSTTNPTRTGLGSSLALRNDRPASRRPKHEKAEKVREYISTKRKRNRRENRKRDINQVDENIGENRKRNKQGSKRENDKKKDP
jgi:hypothetical protein